jgi:DNA-binding NarL/FixJ family response regulator
MRILIADDHQMFREGLKQILLSDPDISVVDEAGNGQDVLNLVLKNKYDVVILDINMPGRNGLEILQELKVERPEMQVLMISMYAEEQFAVQAIKAGASGYMSKNGAAREVLTALRKIVSGGMFISSTVALELASEIKGDREKTPHSKLSPREYQVMRLIASGKRNAEIADELSISPSAVSTHRNRILTKMNLDRNADIIRYAIKHGLVD